MHKLINILTITILMAAFTACSTLPKNSNVGGYRIEQVIEDDSLEDGLGKLMGVVKDASTGERVKAGEIFVYALNKRFSFNEDGSFSEIIPAGKYTVAIESEGYNPITTTNLLIRTKTSTFLNVLLNASSKSVEGPGRTN